MQALALSTARWLCFVCVRTIRSLHSWRTAGCRQTCSPILARQLGVADGAAHRTSAVADLRRLWEVTRIARPDLKTPPFQPRDPVGLEGHTDVLAAARERDILFHHPYDTFQPVVEMIRQAARDPDVVRIALTLYRTDRESPVVHALLDAVRQGKQVRVLVELNARLDEHRNVNWWRMFEQAGASVFPSPAGLKVHAKMALIERHEAGRLRRYAHLSSGNYNAFTARAYTDIALLTCDDDVTADVASLFDVLCSGAVPRRFRALTVSPINMRDTLRTLIEREIACHRLGERGHIILKMNGLVDRDVIGLLYRASQEGVYVDLLVRSLCCLRPGVARVSERIRVRSIVGRFLEHSRVWYFRNGGSDEGVHRQRGSDASEPRPARRSDGAAEGRRFAASHVRSPSTVPGGQRQGTGAPRRRQLRAARCTDG